MIVLGLTGSIAMGKSTCATQFMQLGVAVHDSDKTVADAYKPNSSVFNDLKLLLPTCFDDQENRFDKQKIAAYIFENSDAKHQLEAILHPYVHQSQNSFLNTQKALGAKVVVLDIPLLFETGADRYVDKVVVASASAYIQRQRALARPHMTQEKLDAILKQQIADHKKRLMSDYIVHTGLGHASSLKQIRAILDQVLNIDDAKIK